MRVLVKYAGVLLLPGLLMLAGCGVAATPNPTASVGVEKCGSETRACWQVKTTVEAEDYAATPEGSALEHHESAEQAGGL